MESILIFFWICKSNFCFIMENFPALKTLDWIFVLKIANIWMDWLECIGVLTFKLIENVNIKAVIRQHLVDTESDTTSIVYDHARQGLVRCGSSSGLYLVLVIMQSEVSATQSVTTCRGPSRRQANQWDSSAGERLRGIQKRISNMSLNVSRLPPSHRTHLNLCYTVCNPWSPL